SLVLSKSLTRPLIDIRNTLGLVAQGVLPEASADRHRDDEYGQMATRVDDLVQTLRNNAQFARQIGEGNYQTEFKPASDNDLLGVSLLEMRNNLIENEQKDTERNWIVRGVAEISEILRAHDSIEGLGDDVIRFILGKINAIQGAFYVVNDDDPKNKIIEMRASYAYSRKKYLKAKFKFAEGLVGQAAAEQDAVLRTEIPDDYVTITSGILGDQRPKCVLIVPLITNEEVYGVLEFAGFKKFDSSQVNFVKELSLILARTIFNIKVNERTRRLLEESQAMSNELKEKQEVLRQNAEEMQATQEELERTNRELANQIEEVNHTQSRMQLLLENASEVITIYEEDQSIRYISPSVQTILGYSQKDMQGRSDIDKVHPDYRHIFNDLFNRMNAHPDERATVQFEYKTKDGSFIWIEATGTNLMSNKAIHGFILNARDITERRRAEQEQRMRSKMQALSENSLDLITRLEEGTISYINPVIEQYTGKNLREFLNKKVVETELDKTIVEGWLKVVEEVNSTNDKASAEMEVPSEMGQRVMQVNAIPEFDDNNKLESVLVVSHDITERKMIELEIQNKNKKITESINYSKRIQNAILPNNRVISRTLPDSFILYKPRDVVSGDFPWFVTLKDEVFIAAVDCTGHGVPGAMLSLIGYFLLNDIVRSRKITEPGKILDLLDEGVTSTLRQDEDPTTRDGM
ncbi:MAG: PAS domain S-box protein, partial [Anaerolineae bacterium]|nr:PAS domain S-box protein [Anaerolineae bacterium]